MGNGLIWETRGVVDALRSVEDLLPSSWTLRVSTNTPDPEFDAVADLVGPNAERLTFAVEAKRSGTPVSLLISRLRERARSTILPLMYVSDYIGPKLREELAYEGISYADSTGWVRIVSETPLVLLTGQGAKRSPGTERPAAVRRINGVAASRIVRALTETPPPFGVRELAAIADVSPGSVSKLLPTLAAEGIIDRDPSGGVESVRRRDLVRRWSRDYSFSKTNKSVAYYVAPRGPERTLAQLPKSGATTTLTGSAAARLLLPKDTTSVVPLRLLALYSNDPKATVNDLGLIPTEPAVANAILAVPQDASVLQYDIAPVALVLVDLLTLPSRSDDEAEQLMNVLARKAEGWDS